jgi:hypothetical protein
MDEDEDRPVAQKGKIAANDNGTPATRLDAAVVTVARLIGRQIAREEFERRSPANDNRPETEQEQET